VEASGVSPTSGGRGKTAVIVAGIGIGIDMSGRAIGGSRTMGRDIADPVGEMKSAGAIEERRLISTLGV
jgi:hypothetical protein